MASFPIPQGADPQKLFIELWQAGIVCRSGPSGLTPVDPQMDAAASNIISSHNAMPPLPIQQWLSTPVDLLLADVVQAVAAIAAQQPISPDVQARLIAHAVRLRGQNEPVV